MSAGTPYTHTSNPPCERQIRVLKENVRIWCKTERTKDCVRLLPVISLMMNSQKISATGHKPHELFMGRPAWFLHAPYSEDSYSTVGKWVKEQQDKVDKAKAVLQRVPVEAGVGAPVEQEEQAQAASLLSRGRLGAGAPQSATRLATLHQR